MFGQARARVASGHVKKALLAAGIGVVAGAGAMAAVVAASHGGTGDTGAAGGTTPPTIATTAASVPVVPPGTTPSPVPTTTAALPPPPAPRGPRLHSLMVGVVDDSLAQQDPAAAQTAVRLSRDAGFGAIVLTAGWKRGLTAPPPRSLLGNRNAGRAATPSRLRPLIVRS